MRYRVPVGANTLTWCVGFRLPINGDNQQLGPINPPTPNSAERLVMNPQKRFSGPTTAHTVLPAALV